MIKIRILSLLAGSLAASFTLADTIVVAGQAVSEDGASLTSPAIQVDGRPVDVDEAGRFEISVDRKSNRTLRVEISSDGFYSTVQTIHRSDFVAGEAAVLPTIEMIRKKRGRRLLMFAGDAMLSRRYFTPRNGEPALVRDSHIESDSRDLLQHVKPYVELADYASVNLETQLSAEELTDRLPKSVTFYSPPEFARTLQWAGFDYVALGNNHMFDYQSDGLQSTLETLNSLNLDYSGGGTDDAQARKPAFAEIGGTAHAFLSYVGWGGTFSPSQVAEASKGGAALGNSEVIAEDLRKIPNDASAVLQLHAGLEYSAWPAMSEQTILRQAIRDGADLVLGHHAHVVQGFEIVDDKLIAYSLGNFLFDQYHYTTQMGMLLFVWMDGDRLHRAEAVPLHINGYVPTPATGAFRYAVLHRLAKLSDPRSVCMRPNGLHAALQTCSADQRTGPQVLQVVPDINSAIPVALREHGLSPLASVVMDASGSTYRLGVDILRRGEFEYAGLFGTRDRTWIENSQSRIVTEPETLLRVDIAAGQIKGRTGQKVFERVFTTSNPATVSGRIRVDGDVRVRVLVQRRRTTDSLEAALEEGPLTEIGVAEFSSHGWREFSFDFNQPRIATRSVRLLFEVEDLSENGAVVDLDDLAWVEWYTPWIGPADNVAPTYATHLQYQN